MQLFCKIYGNLAIFVCCQQQPNQKKLHDKYLCVAVYVVEWWNAFDVQITLSKNFVIRPLYFFFS